MKNPEGQDNDGEIEFSDTSFLQLSVIVGANDDHPNNLNENGLNQELISPEMNQLQRELSEGTDLGRDILANIVNEVGQNVNLR
jgi:hypothetical protein